MTEINESRKTPKNAEAEEPSAVPLTQYIGRSLLTCAALFLIALLAFMLIPRTAGFRYALEKKLSKQLGYSISLEKSLVDRDFNIWIEGARVGLVAPSQPGGLNIDRAMLDWSLFNFLFSKNKAIKSIRIDGCSLAFVQDRQNRWEPAPFAKLASFLDEWTGFKVDLQASSLVSASKPEPETPPAPVPPPEVLEEKSSLFDNCRIEIHDGHISWRNSKGKIEALMEGFNLTYTPLHTPDRMIQHFKLTVAKAQSKKSPAMTGVDFEMMLARGNKILLGFSTEEWGPPGITLGDLSDGTTDASTGAGRSGMNKDKTDKEKLLGQN